MRAWRAEEILRATIFVARIYAESHKMYTSGNFNSVRNIFTPCTTWFFCNDFSKGVKSARKWETCYPTCPRTATLISVAANTLTIFSWYVLQQLPDERIYIGSSADKHCRRVVEFMQVGTRNLASQLLTLIRPDFCLCDQRNP